MAKSLPANAVDPRDTLYGVRFFLDSRGFERKLDHPLNRRSDNSTFMSIWEEGSGIYGNPWKALCKSPSGIPKRVVSMYSNVQRRGALDQSS